MASRKPESSSTVDAAHHKGCDKGDNFRIVIFFGGDIRQHFPCLIAR